MRIIANIKKIGSSRILLFAFLVFFGVQPTYILAKRVYQYRDQNGIQHFSDRPPTGVDLNQVKQTLVRAENSKIASLRIEGTDAERVVKIGNAIGGPITVKVSLREQSNVVSNPQLPLTLEIPANKELNVSSIRARDNALGSQFEIQLEAVPGPKNAQHDGSKYAIPFARNETWDLSQGFNGRASHTDIQSRFAVDLAVAEGTPVLAARGGIVMQVEDDFFGAGMSREKYGGRANLVRVLHTDGTMAIYAHLALESVRVSTGQQVVVGQVLGLSGNTGFSSGPHLHFAIQKVEGMALVSIPFEFEQAMQLNER